MASWIISGSSTGSRAQVPHRAAAVMCCAESAKSCRALVTFCGQQALQNKTQASGQSAEGKKGENRTNSPEGVAQTTPGGAGSLAGQLAGENGLLVARARRQPGRGHGGQGFQAERPGEALLLRGNGGGPSDGIVARALDNSPPPSNQVVLGG